MCAAFNVCLNELKRAVPRVQVELLERIIISVLKRKVVR